MKQVNNVFRVRSNPAGISQLETFISNNMIAIGWPGIGNVKGCSRKTILNKLQSIYPEMKENKRKAGITAGFFVRLLKMNTGDIVLVPINNKYLWIAQVTEPYKYDPRFESIDCAHTVAVNFKKRINIKEINKNLKKSIDGPSSVAMLDSEKYLGYFLDIINNKEINLNISELKSYESNSLGKKIILSISSNVTSNDLEGFISKTKKHL